ncbi:MAG: formylglycine-generating enzyme required for sulfatase activity/serine/threonine protein kinase [Planctomycetota bacterium]|jgi:formylglycine-generating enzyme required for sulfatase activity/serine/threonine protein kinase
MAIDREFEQQVYEIAEQAMDLPAVELEAYLERACAGRAHLRREVQRFLDCMSSGNDSLLSPGLQELVTRVSNAHSTLSDSIDENRVSKVPYEQLVDHLATPSEHTQSRYKLRGEVGRGGMAAVLRVWDENLKRSLAMKVILGDTGSNETPRTPPPNSKLHQRFLEEAHITGSLDHPGIVPVHELGIDDKGRVYFTMKLVKGRTLDQIFEFVECGEEGWTQTRALGLILRVCEAVAFAHEKGVIHRDLKPRNVMVGLFGEVYVMDWGLARILGDDRSLVNLERGFESESPAQTDEGEPHHTREGDVLGTPAYMPPEQALGNQTEVGPHSDMYSVGAMIYRLLLGRAPYIRKGEKPTSAVVLARVVAGPPELLEEQTLDTPAELSAICEKAMARDWTQRYANMQDLATDLRAYMEGRVVLAYETGAWPEAKKWVKRNKALASSLAATILLFGVATATTGFLNRKLSAAYSALEDKTMEAEESAAAAGKRADEVLRLSFAQDYEDLMQEAEALWPVHPDKVPELREWISTATSLIEQLPLLSGTREELRRTAIAQTEEECKAQRKSHPEFAKLAALQAKASARRNALLVRTGQKELDLLTPDWNEYPLSAVGLSGYALEWTEPDRVIFGKERLGLEMALRAAELSPEDVNAKLLLTISWAYFAVGDDEMALDYSYSAQEAGSDEAEQVGKEAERLEQAVAIANTEEALAAAQSAIEAIDSELAELQERLDERRIWTFPTNDHSETRTRWWHSQLSGLIAKLESLEHEREGMLGESAISADHGWSVAKRLRASEGLEQRFAKGAEFAERWERALPQIHETHPNLSITMQIGLVPIGQDTDSNLWEFWDVQSGAEPRRSGAGQLVQEEETGLVLVLIPAGAFWMGAQAQNPNGDHYDLLAEPEEQPVHLVELSAFFISKYEVTQGQWLRWTGTDPSKFNSTTTFLNYKHDLTHPVETVSWTACMDTLSKFGLRLPTEAQLEYVIRGGTDTTWWTGSLRDELLVQGAANLADAAAGRGGAIWPAIKDWPELEDGYACHAPVHSFAPNAFGLYNVHGNVWEWCMDEYAGDFYSKSATRDPVNLRGNSTSHVSRGGGYDDTSAGARSSNRNQHYESAADPRLGLRPARAIQR